MNFLSTKFHSLTIFLYLFFCSHFLCVCFFSLPSVMPKKKECREIGNPNVFHSFILSQKVNSTSVHVECYISSRMKYDILIRFGQCFFVRCMPISFYFNLFPLPYSRLSQIICSRFTPNQYRVIFID